MTVSSVIDDIQIVEESIAPEEEIDFQLLTQTDRPNPESNGATKEVLELKPIVLENNEITFNRQRKRRLNSSRLETSKFKTEAAFNSGTCNLSGHVWNFLRAVVAGD